MTLASDLIKDGYREMNVIPVGQPPSAAQQVEGLAVLNRFLQSVFGFLMGETLQDWHVPFSQRTGSVAADPPFYPGAQIPLVRQNNAYPAPNRRIVWDGSTQTIYMPDKPADGARMQLVKASGANATAGTLTLDGNGNTIGSAPTSTTGVPRSWFFRADLADWTALTVLELTDPIPFPMELDDLWPCAIAVRLSSRYGNTLPTGTIDTFKRMLSTLRTRYQLVGQESSGGTELTTSDQSYNGTLWMDGIP
jgi:hypothetical protein